MTTPGTNYSPAVDHKKLYLKGRENKKKKKKKKKKEEEEKTKKKKEEERSKKLNSACTYEVISIRDEPALIPLISIVVPRCQKTHFQFLLYPCNTPLFHPHRV